MKKNFGPTSTTAAFGSRLFDGCKTILRFSGLYGLMSVMIATAGCNPSSTTINQHMPQPDAKASQRETQLTGGTTGGAGDGGGGQGVQCSAELSDTNIKGKLLVRDIYEAIKNHKRSMPSSKLGAAGTAEVDDAAIAHLVQVLKVYFGPASSNLNYVNVEYWKKFAQSISFIADDAQIHPSQDANSPLALPRGCNIVQIAYWDESSGPIENGTLYVDKARWIQLDQFNKIALLAHEFFFKQARKAGYKNSDFVRYKVGQLLSDTGLPPVFQSWVPSADPRLSDTMPSSMNGFKVCEGASAADPTAKLLMYQYEGSDKSQNIVFPNMTSSTLNFSELQVPRIIFSAEKNIETAGITNLLVPTTHFKDNLLELYDLRGNLLQFAKIIHRYNNHNGYFFDSEQDVVSISQYISYALSGTVVKSNFSDIKWTIPSQINSKPMTIILHNPFIKKQESEFTPRPRENLINLVFDYAEGILTYRNIRGFDFETMQSNSILILNKEVDAMISAEKFEPSFPLWEAEVRRLGKERPRRGQKADSPEEQESNLNDKIKFARGLAIALYLLKTNTYTEKKIEALLKVDLSSALSQSQNRHGKTRESAIKTGSISFVQGEEKLTFELSCKDYFDVYKERTHRKIYNTNFDHISDKQFTVSVNQDSFRKDTDRYDSTKDTAEAFAEFLSKKRIISKQDLAGCEGSRRGYRHCQDANNFFADMQDEETLELSRCDGYINIDSPLAICAILKLKKANQKYSALIYFERDKSNKIDRSKDPVINYILRTP